MNVVLLDVARRKERAATLNAGSSEEMEDLRAVSAKCEHGGAGVLHMVRRTTAIRNLTSCTV